MARYMRPLADGAVLSLDLDVKHIWALHLRGLSVAEITAKIEAEVNQLVALIQAGQVQRFRFNDRHR